MSVLNSADVSKIVRMLPREVRKVLLDGECVLAGGFIRDAIAGEEINDIDLFPIYPAPTLSEISPRQSSATLEPCPSDEAWAVSDGRLVRMYVTGALPSGCRWVDDSADARGPGGQILRVPLNRLQPEWEWVSGYVVHPGAGIPASQPARSATRPSTYRLPLQGRNWAVTAEGRPVELYISASIGSAQWCADSRDARNTHGAVLRIPATDHLPSGWQWVNSNIYPGAGYPVTASGMQPRQSSEWRSASEWFAQNTSSTTSAGTTHSWDSTPLAERIANKIAHPYEPEPSQHAFNIKGLGYPVQVIRIGRPESAQQVLDSFDFSVCRAAIWHVSGGIGDYTGWKSLCHDSFYEDLSAKRLVYCSPVDEKLGSSLLRLLKFYGKGFTAPNESIAQIVARVAKNPSDSLETVVENVNTALRNVYGVVSSSEEESGLIDSTTFDSHVMGSSNQTMTEVPANRPVERRVPTPRTGSFVWANETVFPSDPVVANQAVAEAVIQASNAVEQRAGMSSTLNPSTAQRRAYFTQEEVEILRSASAPSVPRPTASVDGIPMGVINADLPWVNPSVRPSGADIPARFVDMTTPSVIHPRGFSVSLNNSWDVAQHIVAINPETGETETVRQPPTPGTTSAASAERAASPDDGQPF